jgi:VWFA-related protein
MQHSKQCRIAVALFSLLMSVVCCLPVYAADETGYTLRSSTDEVRIAFAASDREGRIVKTLRPSDVAVSDNRTIIRHFLSFHPASENPIDLIILLDASNSLASQIPSEISAVKSFVEDSSWEEQDRVSILAFGGERPTLICARNCNLQATHAGLSTLRASGATPLYDALVDAAKILQKGRNSGARPAIILFSDGLDTISSRRLSDALLGAEDLQAAIYCVNARSKKSAPDRGDAILDILAGSTGGLSFPPGQSVASVLCRILDDLHSGYVLTYGLPKHSVGQHSVRILPTGDPKLQFRSRHVYDARQMYDANE